MLSGRGQSSLGDLAVFLEISFELKDDVVEQTCGERVGNFLFQQAIARDPDCSVNRPLWTCGIPPTNRRGGDCIVSLGFSDHFL
jgi:hypothetical protein